MKKVVNIMSIIFILLLFYLTKDSNILSLTVSFSMYILFSSIFSTTNIKSNNYKVFKLSLLSILLLGVPLIIVSYFIGDILDIDKLNIINIVMTLSLISNIILKISRDYLENIGYKKLSNNLVNIYNIITLSIKTILTILLFGVFQVPSYISIISLYSVDILVFIILSVILYLLIFKKMKIKNKDKINYINEIKDALVGNKIETLYNIINSSYIYISIIILYFVLSNTYNYSYNSVSFYITNTYFYSLIVVYYIHKIIKKYLNINLKDNFISNANKVTKIVLSLTILLTIISKPLSYLIFGSNTNILSNLLPLLFIYTIYDFIINTCMIYNKDKNIITSLIIGILVKIIFEVPIINTIYRMGYTLALGSVLSIVLGLIVSIIIGIILIKKKLKINLLDNFNNLLNIIYENIIYTLILVLLTLIVKIETDDIISSILVIIFYIFITITFYIINRKINKDKK